MPRGAAAAPGTRAGGAPGRPAPCAAGRGAVPRRASRAARSCRGTRHGGLGVQPLERLQGHLRPPARSGRHAVGQPVDTRGKLVLRRHDESRPLPTASAPAGRPRVGQRDVDLVADAGDHRHRQAANRPRHRLFVERPEILDRSAAAPDDHDVDALDAADLTEGAGDVRRRRCRPGHGRRDHHVRVLVPPSEHLEDVPDRRPSDRGHRCRSCGEGRQRPLAGGVEQTLRPGAGRFN